MIRNRDPVEMFIWPFWLAEDRIKMVKDRITILSMNSEV